MAATVAEREKALVLLDRVIEAKDKRGEKQITLGPTRSIRRKGLSRGLRQRAVAPHVSEYVEGNLGKNSLTDEERADARRVISQRKRKLIERVFGWSKLDRPLRQVKLRGLDRVDWFYRLTVAAYNLVRMRRLIPTETLAHRAAVCLEAGNTASRGKTKAEKCGKNSPGSPLRAKFFDQRGEYERKIEFFRNLFSPLRNGFSASLTFTTGC